MTAWPVSVATLKNNAPRDRAAKLFLDCARDLVKPFKVGAEQNYANLSAMVTIAESRPSPDTPKSTRIHPGAEVTHADKSPCRMLNVGSSA